MCRFTDFTSVVACALGLINIIIPILAGIALIIFFWGAVKYIYSAGEAGHEQGRELLFWGVIALFVLFCIYGILRLLDNAFLDGTGLL